MLFLITIFIYVILFNDYYKEINEYSLTYFKDVDFLDCLKNLVNKKMTLTLKKILFLIYTL